MSGAYANGPINSERLLAAPRQDAEYWMRARDEIEPFYKEGDPLTGSVESSVAIPMPKRTGE